MLYIKSECLCVSCTWILGSTDVGDPVHATALYLYCTGRPFYKGRRETDLLLEKDGFRFCPRYLEGKNPMNFDMS